MSSKEKLQRETFMQWEAGSCSWFMSEIYNLFPKLFIRRFNRKWKRYQEFIDIEKQIQNIYE